MNPGSTLSLGLLLLGVAVPSAAVAQSGVAGTYRVWLCTEACAVADSAGAFLEAVVVLYEAPGAYQEESWPPVQRRLGPGNVEPNACFRVVRKSGAPDRNFFGIRDRGSTRWTAGEDAERALEVYRSPDAAYQLRWEGEDPLSTGGGWTFGYEPRNFVWTQDAFFAAERVGPPDASACM